jgi:hypothetical protein
MVSGLFEKKRVAISPHPTPPQALGIYKFVMKTKSMMMMMMVVVVMTII